jgi:hypothetical protein
MLKIILAWVLKYYIDLDVKDDVNLDQDGIDLAVDNNIDFDVDYVTRKLRMMLA